MVVFKSKLVESILVALIGLMGIVVLNQLASKFPFRIDLTEEKRYSISSATQDLLEGLDDVVYVDIYLQGDLPSGFSRLQKAVQETLDEFNIYSRGKVVYQYVDPENARGQQARNEFMQYLVNLGIQPTNVFANEGGKRTQKLIFPGAVVSFYGEEKGVLLLKGNKGASPEEILNQSIEGIEFELASAIRSLAQTERSLIGLVKGHDELDSLELAGLTNTLLEQYDVFDVDLATSDRLDDYDALLVIKPGIPFQESEKYRLDQYIMKGGKALFFFDAMKVNMDSAGGAGTVAIPNEVGLRDMLFRYGVRVNNNLVQDLNSGQYPVVAGNIGDQPQITLLPWPFFPVANRFGPHPIVRNIDAVYTKFVSSVDSVKANGIIKTPLIFTSQYSRVLDPPVRVSFNDLREELSPEAFSHGPQVIAYLLEGSFSSVYNNRVLPAMADQSSFIESGQPTKILVCADGDLVRNEISLENDRPLDLGFDQFTRATYANRDFILNTLEYMLDEQGIILARNKEIEIRPLDKVRIDEERTWWQMFNLILPLFLLLVFGYAKYYWRKRKYTNF